MNKQQQIFELWENDNGMKVPLESVQELVDIKEKLNIYNKISSEKEDLFAIDKNDMTKEFVYDFVSSFFCNHNELYVCFLGNKENTIRSEFEDIDYPIFLIKKTNILSWIDVIDYGRFSMLAFASLDLNIVIDISLLGGGLYECSYCFSVKGCDDAKKTLHCIKKAAELNSYDAQIKLGEMYAFGTGVIANKTKASYWFNKAKSQLPKYHPDSVVLYYALAQIYENGTTVFEKDEKKAFEYYGKSGRLGAKTFADWLYEGKYCEADEWKAFQIYMDIAKVNKDPEAMMMLSNLFSTGVGNIPPLKQKAQYWKEQAKINTPTDNKSVSLI